jgi:periplasmic protein TonB
VADGPDGMDAMERDAKRGEAEPPATPAHDSFFAALAADEAEDRRARRRRLIGIGLGLPVAAGLAWLGWTLVAGGPGHQPQQRQVVNTVTRVTLPPPPPPPPPPKVDPPPEPVVQPRVQEPQQPLQRVEPKPEPPAPRPQQPPGPPPALGLPTGPGAANPYGIGGGGGDGSVIGGPGGTGGAGGGSAWSAYGRQVAQHLTRALQGDECTRRGTYSATVRLWVSSDGMPTRAQVVTSSGNPERDRCIERIATRDRQPPPQSNMPQPIITRINARS